MDLTKKEDRLALLVDIQAALTEASRKHGVETRIGTLTFNLHTGSATAKLDIAIGSFEDKAKKEFETYAARYGLKPSDFGRPFLYQGKSYVITGINPKSHQYPILAKQGGKSYKMGRNAITFFVGTDTPPKTSALLAGKFIPPTPPKAPKAPKTPNAPVVENSADEELECMGN